MHVTKLTKLNSIRQQALQLRSEKKSLSNVIFGCLSTYPTVFISIPKACKDICNRKLAGKLMHELREDEIFGFESRNRKTHLYESPDWLFDYEMRQGLKDIFPALSRPPKRFHVNILFKSKENYASVTINNITTRERYNYLNRYTQTTSEVKRLNEEFIARFSFKIRQEKMLKTRTMYRGSPISPTIVGIKSMVLTQWGQLLLCKYPDGAIRYADMKMGRYTKPQEAFDAFCRFADEFCHSNKISPDYEWLVFLKKSFLMPEDAPLFGTQRVMTKEANEFAEILGI